MPKTVPTEPRVTNREHNSYNPEHFARLADIERNHFWFRARNRIISSRVAELVKGLAPGYRLLEVGCGTGNVLRVLERTCSGGMVVGMDLYQEGLRFARRNNNCALVQADVQACPFLAAFDIIGAFDVIEHLPDDTGVLRHLGSMLKPGGTLILTVPAHASLWSYFDAASHHCRRYEIPDLQSKLEESGYRVSYVSEFMTCLFPLIWLARRLAAHLPSASSAGADEACCQLAHRELRIIPVVNQVLCFLLSREGRRIERGKRLPLGTSIIAIAQRGRG